MLENGAFTSQKRNNILIYQANAIQLAHVGASRIIEISQSLILLFHVLFLNAIVSTPLHFNLFLNQNTITLTTDLKNRIISEMHLKESWMTGLRLSGKPWMKLKAMIWSETVTKTAIETALRSRNTFLLMLFYNAQDIDATAGITWISL